ncbi:MAG TPA: response regulator transcription factor [Nitrospiria bacterium]|nr:response regulator transcription factor [Nitrospiria bacterium]
MRVLVVEDDAELSRRLKIDLSRAGFAVDAEADGLEAEFMGREEPYDAIVLDLGLPGRPGLDVLRNWRAAGSTVPVIILTARDAWHEKVDGFKAGADDYLAKPFHVEELIARINAVIRRRNAKTGGPLEVGGLVLDEDRQRIVTREGTALELSGVEFRLLRYFMLHPGVILSKTRLTEHVYDFDSEKESNVIEVYVNRLRQKIGKEAIETRRGQGYVFRASE